MDNFILQSALAALVVLLFGTGMFIGGYMLSRKQYELKKKGVETTAVIRSYTPRPGDDKYTVDVEYNIRNGRRIISRWDVSQSYYYRKRHPEGSSIRIRYLPDRPEKFGSVKGVCMPAAALIMLISGVGLWALSLFIFFSALFS